MILVMTISGKIKSHNTVAKATIAE